MCDFDKKDHLPLSFMPDGGKTHDCEDAKEVSLSNDSPTLENRWYGAPITIFGVGIMYVRLTIISFSQGKQNDW